MAPDQLREQVVHLWFLSNDVPELEAICNNGLELLSPEERDRHRSFQHPERAKQFLLGRILMRRSLAAHTGLDPRALRIDLGPNGKPMLAEEKDSGIAFSLSHSRKTAVIAISRADRIGVDIELTSRAPAVARIARRFFSRQEVRRLESAGTDAEQDAIALWTLKESVVKAKGGTVWDGLAGIELAVDPRRIRWLAPPPEGRESDWFLAFGRYETDSSIALALGRPDAADTTHHVTVTTLGSSGPEQRSLTITRASGPVTTRSVPG